MDALGLLIGLVVIVFSVLSELGKNKTQGGGEAGGDLKDLEEFFRRQSGESGEGEGEARPRDVVSSPAEPARRRKKQPKAPRPTPATPPPLPAGSCASAAAMGDEEGSFGSETGGTHRTTVGRPTEPARRAHPALQLRIDRSSILHMFILNEVLQRYDPRRVQKLLSRGNE